MSKNNLDFEEKLEYQSLDSIMSDRFARYSKYIIQQRALPDVRDGLKPVQRRILYSMNDLGLQYDKPYKKSARVVGDVIGKYHPHGDSSIYEALVRMAQDWKMGEPLIEMHGNKGSIDDDPAAAMRYTETKLSKISSLMLQDLEKNTIPFAPNFDDTEKEPTVLPAYIPNLLLNGAKGIASGFATEIPPHNLGELLDAVIAKIKKPETSWKSLMKYIKGPDFPTGGIVYGIKGIENSFERGQGRITLCSKYTIEKEGKNDVIRILEIPFGVVKSKLVRDIDELRVNGQLNGIKEVRDESDRNGISIAIIVEQESNTQTIVNFLMQKTDMKIYYNYNMVTIVDNAPKVLGVDKMIDAYLKHIRQVKTAAIKFDLAKSEKRLEIIIGFIRVTQIPDEVIKVIRESTGGKQGVIENLQNILGFTLIQATAIAELRLYRLNRTNVSIYHEEKQELEEKINYFKLLLSDSNEFDKHLIEMFREIKKEYAVERKTQIIEEELNINIKQEELIKQEACWISLSQEGYLKRITNKTFESNELNTFGVKEGDNIIYFDKSNTINKLLIFTSLGNYAIIPIHKIEETKWKDEGQFISDFVEINSSEKIISVIDINSFNVKAYVTLITKFGIGKRVLLKEFEASRISKIMKAISFKKQNDALVAAKVSNGIEDIIIITNTTHTVKFSENELPILSARASGNTLIKVEHNWVTAFGISNKKESITLIFGQNNYKNINFADIAYSSRATKGQQLIRNLSPKKIIRDVIKNRKTKFILNNNGHIDLIDFDRSSVIDNIMDDNFNKISKVNGMSYPIINYQVNDQNSYFKVKFDNQSSNEVIKQAEEKINNVFKTNEERLKEIDDTKIDDILKKLKI
ncbi:MAG: DNA topoisomerase IV subunit A [Mycoplasma sp.]|nr:DNA topoisomerase IV subunit A [Mycoplasma sp.]